MASPEIDSGDEPVTPAGRLFLRPEMDQVIHCAVGLQSPLDSTAVRSVLADSVMIAHPRFRSLLVRDRCGRERWRRTDVDVDRHIFTIDGEVDGENAVNDYISDLSVSSPLPIDKPLWELHILRAHNCLVLRVHHALGDGISLMSLFLALCRRVDDPDSPVRVDPVPGRSRTGGGGRGSLGRKLWTLIRVLWFTVMYVIEFVGRSLWVSDRKTAVSGGAGVELWPRKLATAKFLLDDLKTVKKVLPNLTLNDVLFGVISSGLSRYLDSRSSIGLQEGLRITGLAMVNLRKQPGLQDLSDLMKNNSKSKWGNKFGMFLLPVYYHKGTGADSLQYLKRAKAMIDKKKLSLEAQFSYKIGDLVMSCFGPKVASLLNYRIICNTTFTFSNVIGPQEEITLAGNPITYIRTSLCALPHAITMHMLSYAGKADMQIMVAKDIVPDPQFLAKCFEEALLELKEAAAATTQL